MTGDCVHFWRTGDGEAIRVGNTALHEAEAVSTFGGVVKQFFGYASLFGDI